MLSKKLAVYQSTYLEIRTLCYNFNLFVKSKRNNNQT